MNILTAFVVFIFVFWALLALWLFLISLITNDPDKALVSIAILSVLITAVIYMDVKAKKENNEH